MTRSIEVYADIWCPFSHLSLHTVRALRDTMSPGVPVVVRAWPLELVNGKPLDPAVTATHVAELHEVVPSLFTRFDPGAMPSSTLGALALVEALNDRDPWRGERVSALLRETLFEQGHPIDDPLLVRLAQENGVDESVLGDVGPVKERWAEGQVRGVKGSPHIFVGDEDMFCPLLDIERDRFGALQMQERLERLRALLEEGLGPAPTAS